MKLFITGSGFGWCDPANSPCISPDMLVADTDTILLATDGAVKVVAKGTKVEGYSDVESPDFSFYMKPDGKGGWILPPPPPLPDATSALNWQLSVALAAKGVSFTPADATLAARWQFEPSFAIDGAVATALKASLGYDASQLQALFNEAAALK